MGRGLDFGRTSKETWVVHTMIPIEKIICGGQSGADIAGAKFALKNHIPFEINICKDFKPVGRKDIPGDLKELGKVKIVTQKTSIEGLVERTKYNVLSADITIILLDRPITSTKGSKLTMDYCIMNNKPLLCVLLLHVGAGVAVQFYNGYLFWEAISTLVKVGEYTGGKFTINIAGPRYLDEGKGVTALEKLFIV